MWLPAAFERGDLVVDAGELGLEEVEGHDQEDARPAGRIDDPQASQPVAIRPPGLHLGRLPPPRDRGVVAEVRALLRVVAHDAVERLRQMRAERLGHDEAGDVVGGIDHPVPLAPPAGAGRLLGRLLLAARLRLQALDVGDRLLEDVAEDGDGNLRGEVVPADRVKAFADGIGQAQRVDRGIGLEQAAIVARDPQRLAALVDRLEQAEEIVPDRARVVRIPVLEGVAEGVARQEPGVLGEGDEEHAVEDLLGGGDPGERIEPRVGGPNRRDQRVPQAPVVPIHAVGDVAVFAAAVLQQLAGAPRQQVVGRQQQHEARVFPRIGQAVEPEALEGGGAFAEPVEPELDVVRDQHPFHPARVHGVFPRLLHRALVPPRHDRVEVARAGPLQLERRHDLRDGPAEPAEGEIDAPPQDRLLRRDGVVRSLRRPAIAEHALDDL